MLSMMMPLEPPATGRAWLGRGPPFLHWRPVTSVVRAPIAVFHTGGVGPEAMPVWRAPSRLLLLSMIRKPTDQNAPACQPTGVYWGTNPAFVQVTGLTVPSVVSRPQVLIQEGAAPLLEMPAVATTCQLL